MLHPRRSFGDTDAETEFGETLAAATLACRAVIRDAYGAKAGPRYPAAAIHMLIHTSFNEGKNASAAVIDLLRSQLADREREMAIMEEQIYVLWAGLDVQQSAYTRGYEAGLAKTEPRVTV